MTMLSPRVTSKKSLQSKKASLERTIFLNGFDSILGACGSIAASRRKKRRKSVLVKTNEGDENFTQHVF
jgi:hypothetical protein